MQTNKTTGAPVKLTAGEAWGLGELVKHSGYYWKSDCFSPHVAKKLATSGLIRVFYDRPGRPALAHITDAGRAALAQHEGGSK